MTILNTKAHEFYDELFEDFREDYRTARFRQQNDEAAREFVGMFDAFTEALEEAQTLRIKSTYLAFAMIGSLQGMLRQMEILRAKMNGEPAERDPDMSAKDWEDLLRDVGYFGEGEK